ncbi:nucleotidyltransferase domain-containing protein [Aureimonas sp. Leaf454]|uniref:nucleotidyltransferase family protein n=1 Tax=Aureimonas sp. Leaf454 TaxID=1736381 RepID=UPI00329742DD
MIAAHPVSDPRVLGSVARGEDTQASDLDIVVRRRDGLNGFALAGRCADLSELSGVPVAVQTTAMTVLVSKRPGCRRSSPFLEWRSPWLQT